MDYFEFSQTVKDGIVNSPEFMKSLRENFYECKGKYLGGGRFNDHYRIGQLPSGLWIARRESRLN